jgi:hypothetical protein
MLMVCLNLDFQRPESRQLCQMSQTLGGLTPYDYITKCWQKALERFHLNPNHHTVGLNMLKSQHV